MIKKSVHKTYMQILLTAFLPILIFCAAFIIPYDGWSEAYSHEAKSTGDTADQYITTASAPATKAVGGLSSVSNLDVSARIDFDLNEGTQSYYFQGKLKISRASAGVQLSSYITSKDYTSHSLVSTDIKDRNGTGRKVEIINTGDFPTMRQIFYIYDDKPYILTEVRIESTSVQSSNWMGPVVVDAQGRIDIGKTSDFRLLWVPYDNDSFPRYNAASVNSTGTSFEVCAFYDNTSRNGMVVGSVEHDTWKTGIYYNGSNNKLNKLNVFGGANSADWTHDQTKHGQISGETIKSPKVFVGFFDDWRTGLETYATVNTYTVDKLDWSGEPPFGWNSWGGCGSGLNYTEAAAAVNYIKGNLIPNGFSSGFNTVNLDSNSLSDTELTSFVSMCHKNGQKAGIYFTPFTYWGSNMSQRVEGAANYTYGDCVMKDYNGSLLDRYDGAYALDPSHPAVTNRTNYYIDKYKKMGFDYIKLDFLTHGSLEGRHYDTNVKTGIQAYNFGMKQLRTRIGDSMFTSLSIAPLFPYQYAHSRRIACDTFGGVGESEYMLNSVSYGWWMSGKLYSFNDPDQMTLYRKYDGTKYNETDARTRVTGAAIAGTIFFNGDDLSSPNAQSRVHALLTNSDINSVARSGISFKPVEGNTGSSAADIFVRDCGGNTYYIAVFNYSTTKSKNMKVNLSRAGLSGTFKYNVKDLWGGAVSKAAGTLSVSLSPGESRIYMLYL